MKGKAKGQRAATSLSKDRYFNVSLKLTTTSETFSLKKIYNEMKINQLKSYAEFVTGIPKNIQRIQYLDQGDLLDDTDVRSNDIVPGAQLQMDVWGMWSQLIEAVATNDVEWVFQLGVTSDSEFNTPNSQYMSAKNRKQWLADRAFVALYVASHRGHMKLCEKLIATGANLNAATPLGRSSLHVAASQGHGGIVDLLLDNGADIDAEDSEGNNALAIASRFGNKGCERHLFLFRWQQRAKATRTQMTHEMFAHQYFDSAFPVWLKGEQAQVYFTKILPPGEYEGTALGAPKRKPRERRFDSDDSDEDLDDDSYVPSGPDDETRDSGSRQGLAAIKEESKDRSVRPHTTSVLEVRRRKSHKFAQGDKRQKQKTKSFDEWLKRKEAEDAVRMAREKEERRRKREEEAEKKKAAQMKAELEDKSYDQWLAEREAAAKKANKTTKLQQATGGKTTEEIIKNVLDRRREEGANKGIPSDLWKYVRDPTKYQEIQYRGLMLLENYKDGGGGASGQQSSGT